MQQQQQQQQRQLYLYPAIPYIDLHDAKKLDKYIERVQPAHNRAASLRLLINDYIKGSGTAHHTQLHKTLTHTQKKRVEKETQDSKRKLSIPVLNNGKPFLH